MKAPGLLEGLGFQEQEDARDQIIGEVRIDGLDHASDVGQEPGTEKFFLIWWSVVDLHPLKEFFAPGGAQKGIKGIGLVTGGGDSLEENIQDAGAACRPRTRGNRVLRAGVDLQQCRACCSEREGLASDVFFQTASADHPRPFCSGVDEHPGPRSTVAGALEVDQSGEDQLLVGSGFSEGSQLVQGLH